VTTLGKHVQVLAGLPDVGAFPATLVPADVARLTKVARIAEAPPVREGATA